MKHFKKSDSLSTDTTLKADKSSFQAQIDTSIALSTTEVVQRFGSANAEYIKGYTGVDNQTGQILSKGLKDISNGKVHPDYASHNLKQQAGYAAEVAATSRDNAEAIIRGDKTRTIRSDDHAQYGKNHNVVDRVKVIDNKIIEGSQSQMKFVGDRNKLFSDIAKPDGKFARYRGVKLELPSEQFSDAQQYCKKQADRFRKQAEKAGKAGKVAEAERLMNYANNYDELAENVQDSGLSTDEALDYRVNPETATAGDIARTSHRAGIEGAKYGVVIGGAISILTNAFNVAQGRKEIDDAVIDLATDTAKAGVVGYTSAAIGSAIKGTMQQSTSHYTRSLASTSAPALVVSVCLSLGASIKKVVTGEISEAQFLTEVGEKGAGMLSAGMMSAAGQIAIPIPFVGAAVGGMIGYTISSFFYQSTIDAARDVELSREKLERIQAIEVAARIRIAEEQEILNAFTSREVPQLTAETKNLFSAVANGSRNIDEMAIAISEYATLMGKTLQFKTMTEFEIFMNSDKPLML